ncbi:hypothetical protein ACFL54_06635 [Planctomycetota bacterium]
MKKSLIILLLIVLAALISLPGAAGESGAAARKYDATEDGLVMHECAVLAFSQNKETELNLNDRPEFVGLTRPRGFIAIDDEYHGAEKKEPVSWNNIFRSVVYLYAPGQKELTMGSKLPPRAFTVYAWPCQKTVNPFLANISISKKGVQIFWKNLKILAPGSEALKPPLADGHWMKTARNTAANFLNFGKCGEKYLYYGMDDFPFEPPFEITQSTAQVINIKGLAKADLSGVIAVQVSGGKGRALFQPELKILPQAKDEIIAIDLSPAKEFSIDSNQWQGATKQRLTKSLVEMGLYTDEAARLAEICNQKFFHTDGVRLIYRLPEDDCHRLYPLGYSEKPDAFKRVILIMIEK